jgi:PAS domain S-box-containing protein
MIDDKHPASFDTVRMRDTVEAARDLAGLGAWGWDEGARTRFWSPRTKAIFGLPPETDVTREVFLGLMHPDDVGRYEAAWAAANDPTGDRLYRLVYRIRRASDGAERWISSRGRVEFDGDRPVRVAGALRDITEEREIAESLRRSERRFEMALANSHVVVFEQDLDLRYTWVFNPKLGYTADQIIGRTDRELMQESCARELEAIKRGVIAGGRPARAEVRAAAPGGPDEWYDLYVEPLHDEIGAIVGVSCAATDITDRRLASEQINLLLHEVNHRSKNLLTLVQGIARQTLRRHPDDFMEAFGARIQALAANQDVLLRHEWKDVELGALVLSQIQPFEESLGARFILDGPTLHITSAAAQNLGMILHELATNAAKHGALSRATGQVSATWRVAADAAGRSMFSMSWTESGGPEIVEPTRTGFGTAVVRDIARTSLDADVSLDYAPTGFRWRLECALDGVVGAERGEFSSHAGARQSSGANARILVVEDEPLVALELTQSLRDAGFAVMGPARSVGQAMQLLEGGCDAAVLDINLGEETSEPIAHELIRLGKPFFTVSGYAADQRPEVFASAPAFSKPVHSERLIAELGRRIAAT